MWAAQLWLSPNLGGSLCQLEGPLRRRLFAELHSAETPARALSVSRDSSRTNACPTRSPNGEFSVRSPLSDSGDASGASRASRR